MGSNLAAKYSDSRSALRGLDLLSSLSDRALSEIELAQRWIHLQPGEHLLPKLEGNEKLILIVVVMLVLVI